ncbi:MAG TPA: nuclear transport factor 2 family protein [Ferrovibrio sp.]|uniref:nuclear transport factor 2 family protein n=1 Tax=Ferrovibrio sp. TaxID=1917215 RepID=UPI002ED1145B
MPQTDKALDGISVFEGRLRTAVLAGDVDALDDLIADDLILTDQTGRVLTKEMDLAAHRSGLLRISKLEFSDVLSRQANDVVIVVVRAAVAGTYDKVPFAGEYRYTRVWRKCATGWRVAAAHCSAIA